MDFYGMSFLKGLQSKAFKHGYSGHPFYKRWRNMLDRCENPFSSAYKNYGGRGVTVCEEWHDFKTFIKDMGIPPLQRYSIERVDNDKGYSPENCKWATPKEQSVNTRKVKRTYNPSFVDSQYEKHFYEKSEKLVKGYIHHFVQQMKEQEGKESIVLQNNFFPSCAPVSKISIKGFQRDQGTRDFKERKK
jgi:hypothetical protein